ncbi:MAG: hypothetical protein AB7F75_08530 [Planctomycetota bacterium]
MTKLCLMLALGLGFLLGGSTHAAESSDDELAEIKSRLQALEKARESDATRLTEGGRFQKFMDKTHWHGYGEAHYNNPKGETMTHSGNAAEIDIHRMALGLSHSISDVARVDLEIDYEHAAGTVELEYAYFEYDLFPHLSVRVGNLLMPVGHLNEVHEPLNFYSVERPYTQKFIVPTTWQENGFGVAGDALDSQLTYRVYMVNGLDAGDFNASSGIRSGRGGGNQAPAEDWALVGRSELRPKDLSWLKLGASAYYGEADQDDDNPTIRKSVDVALFTADVLLDFGDAEFFAEIMETRISNADQLGTDTAPVGRRQTGSNVQASYHLTGLLSERPTWDIVAFVRNEKFDTNADVPSMTSRNGTAKRQVNTVGLAWYPIPEFVVKGDIGFWSDNAGRDPGVDHDQDVNRINIGVAWGF